MEKGGCNGSRVSRWRVCVREWLCVCVCTMVCASTNFTPFQEMARMICGIFFMFSVEVYANQRNKCYETLIPPLTYSHPHPSLTPPLTYSHPHPSLTPPLTGSHPHPSLTSPLTGSNPHPSLTSPLTCSHPHPSLTPSITCSHPHPSLTPPLTCSHPHPSLTPPLTCSTAHLQPEASFFRRLCPSYPCYDHTAQVLEARERKASRNSNIITAAKDKE